MVASVVYKHRVTNVANIRVRAELVETLVDDRYRESPLYRTFRQLPWQGARLELRPRPDACTDSAAACAGYEAFRSWAVNGRCPNRASCSAAVNDCVEQKSQKLIDTMIVADAILGAADGSGVAVVSMDDDLVPGLLAAARYGRPTALIRFGYRNRPGEYDTILEHHGVNIYDYDDLG
ncbi:hypothetical protein ETAA1_60260 [Urbifossiella limnaea]|uniref:NYN domain-containing protein n=2 Tax=Urbifossiella limnaea TaxID=2528023 RepID=A0A517Y2N6_9BACT|nr:hypothetical protein ETAA1_60260 [Urbifossiella limnaea]